MCVLHRPRGGLTVNAPRCPSFHATVPTVLVGWPGTAFHQLRTFGRAFLAECGAHARTHTHTRTRARSRIVSRYAHVHAHGAECGAINTRGDGEADTGAPWRGYSRVCAFVSAGSRARQWLMVSWMEAFRLLVLAYTVNGPPETAGYTLFPLHQTAPRWRGKNERACPRWRVSFGNFDSRDLDKSASFRSCEWGGETFRSLANVLIYEMYLFLYFERLLDNWLLAND